MADGDEKDPPEGDDGAGDGDEASLPDDAKRLLKHIGKTTREQLNSVLDERLRVEADASEKKDKTGDGGGDGGGGDGGGDAPGRSLAERLGFGG